MCLSGAHCAKYFLAFKNWRKIARMCNKMILFYLHRTKYYAKGRVGVQQCHCLHQLCTCKYWRAPLSVLSRYVPKCHPYPPPQQRQISSNNFPWKTASLKNLPPATILKLFQNSCFKTYLNSITFCQ